MFISRAPASVGISTASGDFLEQCVSDFNCLLKPDSTYIKYYETCRFYSRLCVTLSARAYVELTADPSISGGIANLLLIELGARPV